MRDAHDDVDPWADSTSSWASASASSTTISVPAVVELGHDINLSTEPPQREEPDTSSPRAPTGKARAFRTAPLTSLPRQFDPINLGLGGLGDNGPRRRSATPHTLRDSPEPYSSAGAASGSAYSPTPSRSTSHPLDLSLDASPTTPPPKVRRQRSASNTNAITSPLSLTSTSSPGSLPHSRSLTPITPIPHPALAGLGGLGGTALSDLRDVSRPGLARATSETERAASVGSWSATNSDFGDDGEEVDVIIHTVGADESLTGISLRYGIELQALRRTNKLWPTDPLLRTQLFVPLDACRPSKDAWIERGDDGGATLVRRHATRGGEGEGRSGQESSPASQRTLYGDNVSSSSPSTPRGDDDPGLPDTPGPGPRPSEDRDKVQLKANGAPDRVGTRLRLEHIPLQIARVPASQLRFFPQQRSRGRSSLETDLGRNADSVRALASRPRTGVFAALSLTDDYEDEDEYEPRRPHRVTVRSGQYAEGGSASTSTSTAAQPASSPAKPEPKKSRSKVVRLRPPAAAPPPQPGAGIASKISNFFSVPPPPSHLPPPLPPPRLPSPALSGNGGERRAVQAELVEMDSAPRKMDKKRD